VLLHVQPFVENGYQQVAALPRPDGGGGEGDDGENLPYQSAHIGDDDGEQDDSGDNQVEDDGRHGDAARFRVVDMPIFNAKRARGERVLTYMAVTVKGLIYSGCTACSG